MGITFHAAQRFSVLDIGCGAKLHLPAHRSQRIRFGVFVGADIDDKVLDWARSLVTANPTVRGPNRTEASALAKNQCFQGITKPGETFTVSICKPAIP